MRESLLECRHIRARPLLLLPPFGVDKFFPFPAAHRHGAMFAITVYAFLGCFGAVSPGVALTRALRTDLEGSVFRAVG